MEVAAAKRLLPVPPRDPFNTPSSSTYSSSSSSPSRQMQHHPLLPPSPKPVRRVTGSTTPPFATTFVQADTASFKQVVQMLTGSDTPPSQAKPARNHSHRHHGGGQSAAAPCRPKKPAFKLYDRRGLKNLKTIAPLEVPSPSVLDFPSLALGSPVTPLVADPFNRSSPASPGEEVAAEREAIAHRGFFLHPSPRSAEPPRLLPLFPVTSPRTASSAAQPSSSQ